MTLSLNRLKELLFYDPETGIFTWISSTNNCRPPGETAGYINSLGYVQIGIERIHLGYFKSAKEAHDKYVEASKKYHSQYTRAKP